MTGRFPTSRDNYSRSPDGFVEWAKQRMSRGIRALEENAQEIVDAGKAAVQEEIQAFGRVAEPHDVRDGYESMIDGVKTSVNASRTEGQVSLRVGWDLTEYRDGYPELQDKGFEHIGGTHVVGMQALAYGKMVMKERAIKAIQEGMNK